MNIRRYFDLSQPATFRDPSPAASGGEPPARIPPLTAAQQVSLAWQITIYFILLISIAASRFFDLYRAGIPKSFVLDWQYLLFLAIASLVAFPVVYDKARFNKDQPVLLQIGLIFTAGMGWEKIVATAIGK